ncbi:hypothetical protein N8600_00615 [Gammaproteobacteria bacterium]|nr:hypothetical protein [Gammaproteobacteria bacterium]
MKHKESTVEYALTFDVDWAPDSSIQICLDLLCRFGVKATFFATHHTDMNKEIVLQGHNLGIHPNFLPGSTHGNYVEEIIAACLSFAPNAKCMRTHSLVQSSPLLYEVFSKFPQLELDVSLFMHKAKSAQRCNWRYNDVSFDRLLYNWADDAEFNYLGFGENADHFFGSTIIYGFHPIHVHLNSYDDLQYSNLKKCFSGRKLLSLDKEEIMSFINTDRGVKTFLESIMSSAASPISLEDIQ